MMLTRLNAVGIRKVRRADNGQEQTHGKEAGVLISALYQVDLFRRESKGFCGKVSAVHILQNNLYSQR